MSFDDPRLVSHAGLVPVMALAERAGRGGLVAGMAAGADSIDDMGVLRHGATGAALGGIRAGHAAAERAR